MSIDARKGPWKSETKYDHAYWETMVMEDTNIENTELDDCIIDLIKIDNCFIDSLEFCKVSIDEGSIKGAHFEKFVIDEEADFVDVTFEETSFNHNNIFAVMFKNCVMHKDVIFTNCAFEDVVFSNCNFEHVRFENCTFRCVVFDKCVFSGKFSYARKQEINKIEFKKCDFKDTTIKECTILARKTRDNRAAGTSEARRCMFFIACDTDGLEFVDCSSPGLDITTVNKDSIKVNTISKEKAAAIYSKVGSAYNNLIVPPKQTPRFKGGWECDSYGQTYPVNLNVGSRSNVTDKKEIFITPTTNKKRAYRFITDGVLTHA